MNPHKEKTTVGQLTREIKNIALDLGFDAVGITSAEPVKEAGTRFLNWLSNGFSGEMAYLKKTPEIRFDPKQRFPEAKSVIALALNYYQTMPEGHMPENGPGNQKGRISRYAWGEDYHTIIEKKLEHLITAIQERKGNCWKGYVDHGPLLERAFAQRAGLGFIGKNTNLITAEFGSWVFLAEVVTDLVLEEDLPATGQCGTCTRCIEACPTDALDRPYQLDARRCISYLTIENKGEIPESLSKHFKDWLFGCDICQDVCPFNKTAVNTRETGFSPTRGAGSSLSLDAVLSIPSQAAFKEQFSKTPLLRTKHSGLSRNAKALQKKDSREHEPIQSRHI